MAAKDTTSDDVKLPRWLVRLSALIAVQLIIAVFNLGYTYAEFRAQTARAAELAQELRAFKNETDAKLSEARAEAAEARTRDVARLDKRLDNHDATLSDLNRRVGTIEGRP